MRKRRLFRDDLTADEGSINLTPLIDVVFVVLIMFIIIAPMLELDRIQLASASHKENKEMAFVQENSAVSIRVHEDDSIWFGQKHVLLPELLTLLKRAKVEHPMQIPQLFHDKKAHFGTYQNVKNAIELAGYEQLDIILQPD